MSNNTNFIHDEARIQESKLQGKILDGYRQDNKDLKKLCKKTLSSLENYILNEFKIGDKIPEDKMEKIDNITDILNTGMSKLGQRLLLYGRNTLRETLFPPPHQLTHPYKIFHIGIKTYRMCLEKAISLSNTEMLKVIVPKVRESLERFQQLSNEDKKRLNANKFLEKER